MIQAGKNYGWPRVSLGRNYDGTRVGEGFSGSRSREPVVFWVPAIAIPGLSFYDGDKSLSGKGTPSLAVCAQTPVSTYNVVQFNAKGLPTGREIFVAELTPRIRQAKPGPDGYLYALTDETFGAILRVEPPVTP